MSGRGRRREHNVFAQAIQTLDLKQDDIPIARIEPPPLYPPLLSKPRPLLSGGEYDYMASLREDLKEKIRQAGYYLPSVSERRSIEKYSDKYQHWNTTKEIHWDRNLFPAELFETGTPPRKKRRKVPPKKTTVPSPLLTKLIAGAHTPEESLDAGKSVVKNGEEEEPEGEKEHDEEAAEDEEEEEEGEGEDTEEGTDYVINYFDNDENYLDEADDHLEDSQVF